MTIKEVSEKYGISQDTLRYYERVNVIPKVTRTSGGILDYQEGSVIAKIDLATYEVEYLDERAKRDPYAQEMIRETISDLKQFN